MLEGAAMPGRAPDSAQHNAAAWFPDQTVRVALQPVRPTLGSRTSSSAVDRARTAVPHAARVDDWEKVDDPYRRRCGCAFFGLAGRANTPGSGDDGLLPGCAPARS